MQAQVTLQSAKKFEQSFIPLQIRIDNTLEKKVT
jgi:hypothetical protein